VQAGVAHYQTFDGYIWVKKLADGDGKTSWGARDLHATTFDLSTKLKKHLLTEKSRKNN
jgi:hypothetical protein